MKHDLKLFGFMLFHISVGLFALVLMITAVFPLRAESPQVTELERRVTNIEALQLDHRLTVIETMLKDLVSDHWTHEGTMLGVGLLTMERVARAIQKKIKNEEG